MLHPSLNTESFDRDGDGGVRVQADPEKIKTIFLSINRYERKKNLQLAIKALGTCM